MEGCVAEQPSTFEFCQMCRQHAQTYAQKRSCSLDTSLEDETQGYIRVPVRKYAPVSMCTAGLHEFSMLCMSSANQQLDQGCGDLHFEC